MVCGKRATKCVLFLFTFIYWLFAIAFIAVGVWSYLDKSDLPSWDQLSVYQLILDLSIFLCVVGVLLFILAFPGCVGSIRDNICLLNTFAVKLLLLMILEFVLIILCFVFSAEIQNTVSELLGDFGIKQYRQDPDWSALVNEIQSKIRCCGFSQDGYRDWNNNLYFNCSFDNRSPERCAVPYSCCQDPYVTEAPIPNIQCGYGVQELRMGEAAAVIYTRGCVEVLQEWAKDRAYIFIGLAAGLLVLQLGGILLARRLVGKIREDKQLYKLARQRPM